MRFLVFLLVTTLTASAATLTNVPISGLPELTTNVLETAVFPIVQGGTTFKVSVTNLFNKRGGVTSASSTSDRITVGGTTITNFYDLTHWTNVITGSWGKVLTTRENNYAFLSVSNLYNRGMLVHSNYNIILSPGTNVLDTDKYLSWRVVGATTNPADSIVIFKRGIVQGQQLTIHGADVTFFTIPNGADLSDGVPGFNKQVLNGDLIGSTNTVIDFEFDGINWTEKGRWFTPGGTTNQYFTNHWTTVTVNQLYADYFYTYTNITINGTNVALINNTDLYLPVRAGVISFVDSPLHMTAIGDTNVIIDGGIYFGGGLTNRLYRDTNVLTYSLPFTAVDSGTVAFAIRHGITNRYIFDSALSSLGPSGFRIYGNDGTNFALIGVKQEGKDVHVQAGSGGGAVWLQPDRGTSVGYVLTTGGFVSDTLGKSVGSQANPWGSWIIDGTGYVYGYNNGSSNSYGSFSHTGTNGAFIINSTAGGDAGVGRPIYLNFGGTNLFEFAAAGGPDPNLTFHEPGSVPTSSIGQSGGIGFFSGDTLNISSSSGGSSMMIFGGGDIQTFNGLGGAVSHYGYTSGTGSSGVRVSHGGTNLTALVTSFATGDAGSARPIKLTGGVIVIDTHTPASSSETNYTGAICWDADNLYIWTTNNVNKKVALTAW